MTKPRILDLFCCAGGAGMGYSRAGFDVVGVDLSPQKHYPFEFIQCDWEEAIAYLPGLWEREGIPYAVHASPPCQRYSSMTHRIFESNVWFFPPGPCAHKGQPLPVYGHAGGRSKRDGLKFPGTEAWREGMGIDWMTGKELAEAIPPAYTEYIGRAVMKSLLSGVTEGFALAGEPSTFGVGDKR